VRRPPCSPIDEVHDLDRPTAHPSSKLSRHPVDSTSMQQTLTSVCAFVHTASHRCTQMGCPRIAQQITLAFGIPMHKDVVRRPPGARGDGPRRRGATPRFDGNAWICEYSRCLRAFCRHTGTTHDHVSTDASCTRRVLASGIVLDPTPVAHPQGLACDRACLRTTLDAYLNAGRMPRGRPPIGTARAGSDRNGETSCPGTAEFSHQTASGWGMSSALPSIR
jgi:hypothetical protein